MKLKLRSASDIAKHNAIKTKDKTIGNCVSCVTTPNFLLGELGCGCNNKCAGCSNRPLMQGLGNLANNINGWASDTFNYVKPVLPWILLSGVIFGLVGWKLSKAYSKAKRIVGLKKKKKR